MKRRPGVREKLAAAAARHGLAEAVAAHFERLLHELAEAPDPHTTVADPLEAADAHVADSLCALELVPVRAAGRIVDMGAGPGFPGLALALALPGARVDLIEAQRRKADLIERLAVAGGAGNAAAINERLEQWAAGPGREAYDVATARALGPLPVVLEYAAPLLGPGGTLVVWRGRRDPDQEARAEIAAAELGLAPAGITAVRPFASAHSRHLHLFEKRDPVPARFPRRPGVAARRPLA